MYSLAERCASANLEVNVSNLFELAPDGEKVALRNDDTSCCCLPANPKFEPEPPDSESKLELFRINVADPFSPPDADGASETLATDGPLRFRRMGTEVSAPSVDPGVLLCRFDVVFDPSFSCD